ncbi:YciI family protein [bacterium]|nr:YciI family protein [bacterium]
MRIIIALSLLLSGFWGLSAQEKKYEMKTYYFVMLKKGTHRDQDTTTVKELQKGHMANIQKMADMGKLAIAGPFLDDGDWRGIFIFDVSSKEEVEKLLANDPAIAAGRLAYEIHPWFSARGSKLP